MQDSSPVSFYNKNNVYLVLNIKIFLLQFSVHERHYIVLCYYNNLPLYMFRRYMIIKLKKHTSVFTDMLFYSPNHSFHPIQKLCTYSYTYFSADYWKSLLLSFRNLPYPYHFQEHSSTTTWALDFLFLLFPFFSFLNSTSYLRQKKRKYPYHLPDFFLIIYFLLYFRRSAYVRDIY